MPEARVNMRVGESWRIYWRTKDGRQYEKARLHNISSTGMLIETRSQEAPAIGSEYYFDSELGPRNFIPHNGRIIWTKPSLTEKRSIFMWC